MLTKAIDVIGAIRLSWLLSHQSKTVSDASSASPHIFWRVHTTGVSLGRLLKSDDEIPAARREPDQRR